MKKNLKKQDSQHSQNKRLETTKLFYKGLCLFLISFCFVSFAKGRTDEEFMADLQRKLYKRESYIKILREKGPEAYFKARGLTLKPEEKKVFTRDLMKIMEQKEAPKAYVDKKRKLLIIQDDQGTSELDITLLKKGLIKGADGKTVFIYELTYSELKKVL